MYTFNHFDVSILWIMVLVTYLNDATATVVADIDINLKDWPKIPPSVTGDTVVQNLGPAFFFCSEMVVFIIMLNQLVTEKEQKLRASMQMMGLTVSIKKSFYYLLDPLRLFLVFKDYYKTNMFLTFCDFRNFRHRFIGYHGFCLQLSWSRSMPFLQKYLD